MLRAFLLSAFTIASVFIGCSKGGEQDDLAKAQSCLDHVNRSTPQTATDCLTYIQKYDSKQANNLKCAIYLTSGGLVETKIAQAYKLLTDKTQQNKGASFLTAIALDKPDANSAYATATTADSFCQKSGLTGVRSLSKMILSGTLFNKSMVDLGIGAVDTSDPASVNTAVQSLLTQCATATPAAGCPDAATLGSSVSTLSTNYCAQPNADKSVCDTVNGAIASAGGSDAIIGQAALCYMKNQKYNAQTGDCY